MHIADLMMSKNLLQHEKYSEIKAAPTNPEKMRVIYEWLHSSGHKGKAAFYDILKQVNLHLVIELIESNKANVN